MNTLHILTLSLGLAAAPALACDCGCADHKTTTNKTVEKAGACSSSSNAVVEKSGSTCSTTCSTTANVNANMEAGLPDIIEAALATDSLSTLATAIKAAGLVEALQSEGPFTVFAPTNDAFAKLPAGTVATLLKPENINQLRSVLLFHVAKGTYGAKDVTRLSGLETLQGQRVSFDASRKGVTVDGAGVVSADIQVQNGVIHVVDTVLLPSSNNIVSVAQEAGMFNTLLAAAKAAGLVGVLTGSEPVTVFAPTDEAFAKLPAGTVESLLKPENKDQLAAILAYHVVPGRVYAKDALSAGRARTAQGSEVVIDMINGKLKIDSANVIANDIDASNGVVHIIDSVILPQA
jgi:transforming growth factor-beta-induced protein